MSSDWESRIDRLAVFVADYLRNRDQDDELGARERTQTWIEQFPLSVRYDVLTQLASTLDRTYVWERDITEFLEGQVGRPAFWGRTFLCHGARQGQSHAWATAVVEDSVKRNHGDDAVNPSGVDWRSSLNHLFIDDAVFSGGRVREDYCALWDRKQSDTWTPRTPEDGPLDIIILHYVTHTAARGDFATWADTRLRKRGFDVQVRWVSSPEHRYQDLPFASARSDVLWPLELTPAALESDRFTSIEHTLRREHTSRTEAGSKVFPDPAARRTLESALLDAGMDILGRMSKRWPPLGFAGDRIQERPLGFGTLAVTFRNCPNNAPLALWWDTQDWIPLFPRRTYAATRPIAPPAPKPFLPPHLRTDDVPF